MKDGFRLIAMEDVPDEHEVGELDRAYAQMAQDEQRETEALDWVEGCSLAPPILLLPTNNEFRPLV